MKPFRILVIEDNPGNAKAIWILLRERIDIVADFAETGDEALKKLLATDYQLILMDIKLPDINGYELVRIVKRRKKTSHVPVVFMTGVYLSDEDKRKGYSFGASDYIFKPVDANEFNSKMDQYAYSFKRMDELLTTLKEKNRELERKNKELWSNNRKIEYLTFHDGLTNLYNRNYFDNYALDCSLKRKIHLR